MLTSGARIGPFEVLSTLGAGGMGEVYRAHDPRLDREVALKVLPAATLSDETARARMLREARLAAKLNHPHVCTVHEVGEADGRIYIAMELVEGRSLAALLAVGALSTEQVLRYGVQVADALAHAHSRGVVHRDLKSANIVLAGEGRAKVLDFGLATRVAGEDLAVTTTLSRPSLTEPGRIAGTIAYMAPEQLRGQPADVRSDIWALGVVLHEMAGGRRPFQGSTGFELASAILNEAPAPLPASAPTVLQEVIARCLAKAPGERFQKAAEVRVALEAVESAGLAAPQAGLKLKLDRGGGNARVIRMAVLPFANLTGDPEQEYLSDGITQEMISQLGRLHPGGLSVIARTSVMRYKNGDTPVDQIGRELNVGYVLEGSAQREADRVRIAAELIDVRDQAQLWAETYDRALSGILTLQSEVAQRVARALALTLLPDERARLASAHAVDPEAYDAYLKGSYHWKHFTPADLDTAQRYFERALEKDPAYAPAYEGLAWVWAARQQFGMAPPHEAGPKAKAAAVKAIELDDDSAEAHEALALVTTWTDWDWAGAEPEWRRALVLNPSNANAHAYYAHFLANTGRVDEAVPHSERSLELDPFNALFHGLRAAVLCFDRRYDDALAAARTALALQPGHPVALSVSWIAASGSGQHAEALAAAEAYLRVCYEDHAVGEALELGLAQGGYPEAMRRAAGVLVARSPASYVLPTDIAFCYLEARDHPQALDWLDRAFELRDPNMPYIGLPFFDPLRPDPRFQNLLHRMNLSRR